MTGNTAIRDAATVIAVRDAGTAPQVLMGQRAGGAVFMPNKVVFPGGAVDPEDARVPLAGPLGARCRARLGERADALAAAAIRELWEETGLVLGRPGPWTDTPEAWRDFAAMGHRPDASPLVYVFRAITPPSRPRRFDARFFLCDAACLAGDLDDFSNAGDELAHLAWRPLSVARRSDLPFITAVALAEIAARLPDLSAPERVPFFRNDVEDIAVADDA